MQSPEIGGIPLEEFGAFIAEANELHRLLETLEGHEFRIRLSDKHVTPEQAKQLADMQAAAGAASLVAESELGRFLEYTQLEFDLDAYLQFPEAARQAASEVVASSPLFREYLLTEHGVLVQYGISDALAGLVVQASTNDEIRQQAARLLEMQKPATLDTLQDEVVKLREAIERHSKVDSPLPLKRHLFRRARDISMGCLLAVVDSQAGLGPNALLAPGLSTTSIAFAGAFIDRGLTR